jgi:hypothetical protein
MVYSAEPAARAQYKQYADMLSNAGRRNDTIKPQVPGVGPQGRLDYQGYGKTTDNYPRFPRGNQFLTDANQPTWARQYPIPAQALNRMYLPEGGSAQLTKSTQSTQVVQPLPVAPPIVQKQERARYPCRYCGSMDHINPQCPQNPRLRAAQPSAPPPRVLFAQPEVSFTYVDEDTYEDYCAYQHEVASHDQYPPQEDTEKDMGGC